MLHAVEPLTTKSPREIWAVVTSPFAIRPSAPTRRSWSGFRVEEKFSHALVASDGIPDVAALRSARRDVGLDVRDFPRDLGSDEAGRMLSSLLWHMVQHVVNHASYHRGQVTTMLRQIGAARPLSTDLIAYYRLREKELARQ